MQAYRKYRHTHAHSDTHKRAHTLTDSNNAQQLVDIIFETVGLITLLKIDAADNRRNQPQQQQNDERTRHRNDALLRDQRHHSCGKRKKTERKHSAKTLIGRITGKNYLNASGGYMKEKERNREKRNSVKDKSNSEIRFVANTENRSDDVETTIYIVNVREIPIRLDSRWDASASSISTGIRINASAIRSIQIRIIIIYASQTISIPSEIAAGQPVTVE